ncbi:MAG: hypothetical protein CXX70_01500, partial [Methanobacteriota archaeon]
MNASVDAKGVQSVPQSEGITADDAYRCAYFRLGTAYWADLAPRRTSRFLLLWLFFLRLWLPFLRLFFLRLFSL